MKIWKLLLLTYLFSVILTIIFSFILLLFTAKGGWDIRLLPINIAGSLFINIPLTFIAIPGLFMSISFEREKKKAFVACFITPAAILVWLLTASKIQRGDLEFYTLAVISFMIVLGYFFYKNLTPNNPSKTGSE